jgi:hypothetical protein
MIVRSRCCIHQTISNSRIERRDECIVGRLPRLNEEQLDGVLRGPLLQRACDTLRTVVHAKCRGVVEPAGHIVKSTAEGTSRRRGRSDAARRLQCRRAKGPRFVGFICQSAIDGGLGECALIRSAISRFERSVGKPRRDPRGWETLRVLHRARRTRHRLDLQRQSPKRAARHGRELRRHRPGPQRVPLRRRHQQDAAEHRRRRDHRRPQRLDDQREGQQGRRRPRADRQGTARPQGRARLDQHLAARAAT